MTLEPTPDGEKGKLSCKPAQRERKRRKEPERLRKRPERKERTRRSKDERNELSGLGRA